MSTQNYSIVQTTVAATSIDLTTLDNLKADLGADASSHDDVYLRRLITQSSTAIANYCNRVFPLQTYTETLHPERDPRPYFLPNSQNPLALSRAPLVKVTSVTEGGTLLSATTDFETDIENAELYRIDGNGNTWLWPSWKIVAVYTAGWLLPGQSDSIPASGAKRLPADLEHAVIRLVASSLYARKRDPMLRQEDVAGIGSRVYWIGAIGDAARNFSPDVEDIINNYRVPVIA